MSEIVKATDEHAAGRLPASVRLSRDGRLRERVPAPHAGRFRFVLALLGGVGAAAVVLAVALLASGTTGGPSFKWSDWKPQDGGQTGAQEIADFVAPYYRATPISQLAVVTALDLASSSNPLQIVLPSPSAATGVQPLPPTSTIAYNLCGVGSSDCSIGVGAPSMQRLLLLRREALELALYTFKYIGTTQNVVAILPPGHTTSQACSGICPKPHTTPTTTAVDLAIAFDRRELQPWLNQPLRNILPEQIPPTVSQVPLAPEAELVSIITAHGLFQAHSEQAQDGSRMLLLQPQPPQ